MTKKLKVPIKSRKQLPRYSDVELTILAERVGLTLPLLKELHRAGHATYEAIGYDLAALNEGKGMKREELVEVVLDASYIEMYGGPSPELKTWLHSTKNSLEDVYGAMAAGFPYALYE
jgi:hypothetical protein